MKAILRSINNFSCKLKQSNNLKYNISPKIRSNKFKNISGNGNIVIEDAIKKDLKDYKMYGNTYQDSTKGINIYNIRDNKTISSGYIIDNEDYITNTYNHSSATGNEHYENLWNNINSLLKPSTNYIIVCEIKSVSGSGILYPYTKHSSSCINTQHSLYNFSNLSAGQKILIPVTTKSEFTSSMYYDLRTLVRYNAGQSGSITFRLSLLTDTTITSDTFKYELYTGGQPSPNPNYPQEIVSCGDRTKNLLPTNVSDWEQGTISTSTGLNTNSTTRIRTIDYYEINNDTNYYISLEDTDHSFLNMFLYNSQKEYVGQYFTIDSEINGTRGLEINIPSSIISNVKYCRVTIRNLDNSATIIPEEISTIKPMIALGNTKLNFEPYGYKIPVNVRSENLCNGNLTQGQYRNGVFENDINRFTTDFLEVTPSTQYTFSLNSNDNLASLINLAYFDENKNFLGTRSTMGLDTFSNTDRDKTITTTNQTYYLRWTLRPYGSKSSISYEEAVTQKLQFEKGNKTLYKPYYNETTNIYLDEPLRKIDGYSDYIDFVNGKVVRNIGKIILNGSEDWTAIQVYSRNYYAVTISNLLISDSGSNDALLYNNYYIGYKSNELVGNNTKDYGICRRNNNSQVLFRDKDQSILSDLTTWLSTHNNIMCYPLATPTEEDIELPNINLIEGKNIITLGTEVQGVFEVEYYSKEIIDISNYKYNLRKVED